MKRGTKLMFVLSAAGVAIVGSGGCASNSASVASASDAGVNAGSGANSNQAMASAYRSSTLGGYTVSAGVGDTFGAAVFRTPDMVVARLNSSNTPAYATVKPTNE